ncbi:MAG: chemotaxis protein CheA [Deferrisomatales bacterium]
MEMERYRELFLTESHKHLQIVEERMLAPGELDQEALDAVFREIHSLKGMAASMGYEAMAELAHRLEDLLDRWRGAGAAPPPDARDRCLRACDRLAEMRDDVASGGAGDLDWADLEPTLAEPSAVGEPDPPQAGSTVARIRLDPGCESPAARAYLILLRFREIDPEVASDPPESEILQGIPVASLELRLHGVERADVEEIYATLTEVTGLEFPQSAPAPEPEVQEAREPDPVPDGEGAVQRPGPEAPAGGEPLTPEESGAAGPAPARPGGEESRMRLPETVQAPIQLLDEFVDLLGEMTISRSHLEDMARSLGSEILRDEVDRLGKLVRAFHGRVMALRMLPFALITGSLKRLVREHSAALGKEVELRISGEEIGMDKSILLQVSDPLVHLLRNALDHGLETPERRRARGKPPRGVIEIRAARARNQVEITVADDGVGIDVEAVRRRAVERGLFREEESRRLGSSEILACLFRPGFTTRDEVSRLSGRGVGLDVVKSRVDALGGTVDVVSTPGAGAEFRLRLPLSVAIVPVLMVLVGESVLALPTSHVTRTVEAQPQDVRKKETGHVLLTESGQVPILSLARVLRLEGKQRFDRVPLVIAQTGRGMTALAVDAFLREEDLFIKPVRGPLRALQGLSGYSVLGDGRLVFLLDPPTLFGA